jgi:hypothetical protein
MDELLAWRAGSVIVDAVAGARRRPAGIRRLVRGVTVQFRRIQGIQTFYWKRPRRVSR